MIVCKENRTLNSKEETQDYDISLRLQNSFFQQRINMDATQSQGKRGARKTWYMHNFLTLLQWRNQLLMMMMIYFMVMVSLMVLIFFYVAIDMMAGGGIVYSDGVDIFDGVDQRNGVLCLILLFYGVHLFLIFLFSIRLDLLFLHFYASSYFPGLFFSYYFYQFLKSSVLLFLHFFFSLSSYRQAILCFVFISLTSFAERKTHACIYLDE